MNMSILTALFKVALFGRFLFPFWYNPMHHLFSDPQRHWLNGLYFFSKPVFMNGVDAKLYQLFIWLIIQISQKNIEIIAALTGLLCAVAPYVWYKAARELLPKKMALICALVIALHPSLLLIYSYFMLETLAIPLLGLGVWLTLRARRKGTSGAFLLAVAAWVLAMHTRTSLIPVALMSVCFMLAFLKQKRVQTLALSLLLFAVPTFLAASYSARILNIYSPFVYSGQHEFYYYSGLRGYRLEVLGEGRYGWASSIMDLRPLEPFSDYTSYRSKSVPPYYVFTFRKADGTTMWNRAIAQLKANYDWKRKWLDVKDNVVFFTFGSSWPDSGKPYRALWELNTDLRWTWPLPILAVLLLFPFLRQPQAAAYITGLVFVMILLMYFQESGVMEGRYRKPFEPLLILAVPLLWQALRRPLGRRPLQHFLQLAAAALGKPISPATR